MSYLLEGYLVKKEKPTRYMDKFVDLKSHVTTSLEGTADILNRRRKSNFVLINTWNDAERLCRTNEVVITQDVSEEPTIENITEKYAEDDEHKTIEGQLRLWKEFRFPNSMAYVFSSGSLEKVFEYDGDKFYEDVKVTPKGKKKTFGLLLPLAYIQRTRGKVAIVYDPGEPSDLIQTSKRFGGSSFGISFFSNKILIGYPGRLSFSKELPK